MQNSVIVFHHGDYFARPGLHSRIYLSVDGFRGRWLDRVRQDTWACWLSSVQSCTLFMPDPRIIPAR